jgi:alpha-L-fucosidase
MLHQAAAGSRSCPGSDPAHKENARIMKNELYQQVRELVTDYGHLDVVWWDGGWLSQRGSDADAAFFWEPGKFRDAANEWPVDAAYSENDAATGRPLGITGLVREHQPDVVSTYPAFGLDRRLQER